VTVVHSVGFRSCDLRGGGRSLPLVLCNHVCTKGMLTGAIYLLIWILGNPLSRKKKTTSLDIQHPIGNYKRKPRLFQMMPNYS
jgi:hypothetical protein